MFSKPRPTACPVTVVSAGSALQGDIRVRGALHIDGAVCGNVTTDGDMSVGPDGYILGEVRARTLRVGGRIDGIVHVRQHLCMLRTGHVRGHASYHTLEIERGGVMDGSTSFSSELPAGGARDEDDEYVAAE